MIRVCIVCEGGTEVEFIKSCLTPHLLSHGVYAYPVILQAPSGGHRGGRVSVERLARMISHEYFSADRLTTLVDYYGFQNADGRTCEDLENDIFVQAKRFASRPLDLRFVRPYVQMYEFEGLLFSDVEQFRCVLDGWNDEVRENLIDIRSRFTTPEDINNHRETAPSKRIISVFSDGSYNKTEHGPLIAEKIGLATIRRECPRFNAWLALLEEWSRVDS